MLAAQRRHTAARTEIQHVRARPDVLPAHGPHEHAAVVLRTVDAGALSTRRGLFARGTVGRKAVTPGECPVDAASLLAVRPVVGGPAPRDVSDPRRLGYPLRERGGDHREPCTHSGR